MQKAWLVCLLISLALLLVCVFQKKDRGSAETFNVNSVTKEEIKDELIIALFIEDITNEILIFYSQYYLGEIAVYNYEVKIVNIEKTENGFIFIQFGVTPQVGAHNPLGYDELSYTVDSGGNQKLVDYEHIRNYDIPDKFQENYIQIPD